MDLKGYVPRTKLQTNRFIVRTLVPSDAQMDYEAVMSSIDTIKAQRGGTWPKPDLTLEKNIEDLKWHESEFKAGRSFAYVITNLEGNVELGCIYFYPPEHPMNNASVLEPDKIDVSVNFWVTQDAFNSGLYSELYMFIEDWLKDWSFENPVITNPLKPTQ